MVVGVAVTIPVMLRQEAPLAVLNVYAITTKALGAADFATVQGRRTTRKRRLRLQKPGSLRACQRCHRGQHITLASWTAGSGTLPLRCIIHRFLVLFYTLVFSLTCFETP